jgi:hypothetical protein
MNLEFRKDKWKIKFEHSTLEELDNDVFYEN